jgi:hypothetical protein
MKNIVKFKQTNPQGAIVIDGYNPEFANLSQPEFLNLVLPYTKLYEKVVIKNFYTLSQELLNRLTVQYLHGATVIIDTPKRNFRKEYTLRHPKAFYTYYFEPLDLSKPIPKSLANFKFNYTKDLVITYLQAVQNKYITSAHYMPESIWKALDDYSKAQIEKCKQFNLGDYDCAEQWYKDLMHDCIAHGLKMFSPNKKTYYEVTAEIDFEKCKEVLPAGLRPLNQEELSFLHKYAPAYGVEIPKFMWRYNTRKTDHGYTEEPERVYGGMSNTDWSKVIYDYRNAQRNPETILPKNVRGGLRVQSMDNDKLIREAYTQLVWLMKHMKDEALMPGYKRCPVCHEIYKESQGCECGACPGYDFIPADNLFYGDSSSYEDYDSTRETYSIMINEDSEDLLV